MLKVCPRCLRHVGSNAKACSCGQSFALELFSQGLAKAAAMLVGIAFWVVLLGILLVLPLILGLLVLFLAS